MSGTDDDRSSDGDGCDLTGDASAVDTGGSADAGWWRISMSCSWRATAACLLAVALWVCAASASARTEASEAPGQARLKGRIGETPLEMIGRCRLARKGEPFIFWSDGDAAPALGDANRDGLYLVVALTREPPADPVATVVFRHQGRVVFDGTRLSAFTLSGNTLSVDTLVTPAGGADPILLRLAIVCDTV